MNDNRLWLNWLKYITFISIWMEENELHYSTTNGLRENFPPSFYYVEQPRKPHNNVTNSRYSGISTKNEEYDLTKENGLHESTLKC